MLANQFSKTILSIVSITSIVSSMAMAQLRPGPPAGGGGNQPPPHYNPCDVPTDPNCHHGGYPGNGDGDHGNHGGYPGNGGNNPYPSDPSYPSYPTNDFGRLTMMAINGQLGYCSVRTHVSGWANQLYVRGSFAGNYEDGTRGYDQDDELESAIQSQVNIGSCGNVGGYNPHPPVNPYPSNPGQGSSVFRTVQLNRAITNQSIDLRQLAGLDSRYDGYRVVSVAASTTPNSPATTIAQLVIDGSVYDSQTNPGHEISLYPQYDVRLNRNATRIFLAISGSTIINELRIELSRY